MERATFFPIVVCVLVVLAPSMVTAGDLTTSAWPDPDWPSATPESQGLSSAALQKAVSLARNSGGGSGCIIRHGYIVEEWGSRTERADIKSATKGSVGTTILGLAVDCGLVGLDDIARKHSPSIGAEKPENVAAGWLGEITVRHLATMTAGFDDGRPPRLSYRPGTSGIYSNDTSNMLAELLTLKFGEDLSPLLERRVMGPLGVPRSEWAWRKNSYRPKTIGGLKSREFASGITITHRALARIGYLYLRDGEWKGRRVLSKDFIRAATRPADLPAPWPYYGFYWGTNARGTYREIPVDTFWALGLGDSFVAVCPSLDIVAVRLGLGSTTSQLPGGEDWGQRVADFFKPVTGAVGDPCSASPAIRAVTWAPPETILRKAGGSDNWPLTWADDGDLYAAYGDGRGFDAAAPRKLSLGLARIRGGPADFSGINLPAPGVEQEGDGPRGKKASGLLGANGVLYLWARNAGNSQLAWSPDRGATWTWSPWKFTVSFGCPTFLNFGQDNAGARDSYVYVYSHDSDSAYEAADRMVLARVSGDKIRSREDYDFFEALDSAGKPLWTKDISRRGSVFSNPGKCYRSTVGYCAALRRHFWCQTLPGPDPRSRGGFGIHDAPEPWGPWTTVYYTEEWDVGPGETSSLPPKWMGADGKTLHLVFSGDDSFSVRKLTLELR